MSRPARTSSVLLVSGAALAVVGGILHPHEELPNSHAAVFSEYAESTDWVWVHYLQFLSAALVVAGFLVLGRALRRLGALRPSSGSARRPRQPPSPSSPSTWPWTASPSS